MKKSPSRTKRSKPFTASDARAAPNIAAGSRRDLRMLRARQHLAEAGVRLIEQKGFAAATIDAIAEHAHYSTSTFFRLFTDKEEIVFYDFQERLEELHARFAAPHEGNAWQTIRSAFIENARRWDGDELAKRRVKLFHSEPLLQARYLAKCAEWENAITRMLAAEFGTGAEGKLSSRLIAGSAIAAFRAAFWSQLDARELTLETCLVAAFDQLEQIGSFFHGPAEGVRPLGTKKHRRAIADG